MNRERDKTMIMSNPVNTAYIYGMLDTATGQLQATTSGKRMYRRTSFRGGNTFTRITDDAFVAQFTTDTEPLVGRFLVENCEHEGEVLGIDPSALGSIFPELVIWDYRSDDMEMTGPTTEVPYDTLVPKAGVQKVAVGIKVDAIIGILLKSLHTKIQSINAIELRLDSLENP
jgi:hypothetical protein